MPWQLTSKTFSEDGQTLSDFSSLLGTLSSEPFSCWIKITERRIMGRTIIWIYSTLNSLYKCSGEEQGQYKNIRWLLYHSRGSGISAETLGPCPHYTRAFGGPISTQVWGFRYYVKDFLIYLLVSSGNFSRYLILILVWFLFSLFCAQTLSDCYAAVWLLFPQMSLFLASRLCFSPSQVPSGLSPTWARTSCSHPFCAEWTTRDTHFYLLSLFFPIRLIKTLMTHGFFSGLILSWRCIAQGLQWIIQEGRHGVVKSTLTQ